MPFCAVQLRCDCPCTFFPISSAFRKGIFPILWYKEFNVFHRVINHEDRKCHNLLVLSYGVTWSAIQRRSIFFALGALLRLILWAFCIWMVLWLEDREMECLNSKVIIIMELWQSRLGSLFTNFLFRSVSKNNLTIQHYYNYATLAKIITFILVPLWNFRLALAFFIGWVGNRVSGGINVLPCGKMWYKLGDHVFVVSVLYTVVHVWYLSCLYGAVVLWSPTKWEQQGGVLVVVHPLWACYIRKHFSVSRASSMHVQPKHGGGQRARAGGRVSKKDSRQFSPCRRLYKVGT